MKVVDKEFWLPSDGIKLEQNALDAVKADFNLLISAGPGAGKTELLAQKACYLLQTNTCKFPQKILAISFKRDAAKNLKERVEKRCGTELSRRFTSLTYDAFAKGLLDRFMNALPDNCKPKRTYEIASIDDLKNLFETIDKDLFHQTDRTVLINSLVNKDLRKTYNLGKISSEVWNRCLTGKNIINPMLSFQMISYIIPFLIEKNPHLKKLLNLTYSHVFLDEFQDTTTLQYEMIKTIFFASNSILTAVGDTKQTIMRWAGAKTDIFLDYQRDFSANEKELYMNHRSAPRLIKVQEVIASKITGQTISVNPNGKWNSDDGICEVWYLNDELQEAKKIIEEINKHCDSGLKKRDVCVLVKRSVDEYAKELFNNSSEIQLRNEDKYQDLLTEELIRIIVLSVTCAFSMNASAWSELTNYIHILEMNDMNSDDEKKICKMRNAETNLRNFLKDLKDKLVEISSEKELIDVFNLVLKYCKFERVSSVFPKYNRVSYLNDLISRTAKLIIAEYNKSHDWIESVSNFKGENSVPVMTIHKSKGLEYDTIFFIGLEDDAFFSFEKQRDEDTCAFFVALSRAKRKIVFTYCTSRITTRRGMQNQSVQSAEKIKELYSALMESEIAQGFDYRD